MQDYAETTAPTPTADPQVRPLEGSTANGGLFLANPARNAHYAEEGPQEAEAAMAHRRFHWRRPERRGRGCGRGHDLRPKYRFNAYFGAADLRGQKLWERQMSTSQSFATSQPCVDRGVLYMATNHGLYCPRCQDRSEALAGPHRTDQRCAAGPRPVHDLGAKKGLFAVAISNGRKKCVYASAASVSTPACADGVLYFLDEQHLVAMEAEQGKVLWKTAAQEHKYPRPGPAILDDLIFFPDEERRLAAGERSSGRKQWAEIRRR